jgi:ABC-type sulfate transport system permease subunit
MPGNLTGITINNEQKILQTYGMIAVEMEGSSGEALNIAGSKQATISFPIPSAMLANAPATIPLWHFDETIGVWKEEGTATKQGNAYVGVVTHFSFWNCDVPAILSTLR